MTPVLPRTCALACLVLSGWLGASQVSAAPITIQAALLRANVYDGASVSSSNSSDPSTTYVSRSVTATQGGSSSTTFSDWTDTGSGALFEFGITQVRSGVRSTNGSAYAYSEGYLRFTVGSANTTYELAGDYAMTGPANRVQALTYLRDLTTGDLFFDYGLSDQTANESFDLGVVGDADNTNYNVGSLTGTLLANRQYEFSFVYYIQAFSVSDNGATAAGCVTLSIGGASASGQCGNGGSVPEPGSIALAGLALAGLGCMRRRVRQA